MPRPSSIIEMSASLWENGKFEPQQRRRWRKMKKMFPIQTEKKKKSKVGKILQHSNTDSSSTTNSEGSGSNEGNVFEDP